MEEQQSEQKKSSKVIKRIFITLLLIALIPIMVSLLLHYTPFQNWAVQKLSKNLSDKTEADISIGHIDFSVFRGIDLADFKLAQKDGNEILSCKNLSVKLSSNVLTLINGKLTIKSIYLYKPNVKITIDSETRKTDLALILEKLAGEKKDKKESGSVLNLKISSLDIDFLKFQLTDQLTKSNATVSADKLKIKLNIMDLATKQYDVSNIYIDKPQVYLSYDGAYIGKKEIQNQSTEQVNDTTLELKNYPLNLLIETLSISNGKLILDDISKPKEITGKQLDLAHLDLNELNMKVNKFSLCANTEIQMDLDHFSFVDNNGWSLEKLQCHDVVFDENKLILEQFIIKTKLSSIGNAISLNYNTRDDLNNFKDKVLVSALFDTKTVISLEDLAYLIKGFDNSKLYQLNKAKEIKLSGKLTGRLSNLKGSNIELRMPGIVDFKGSFGVRNAFNMESALINLRVNQLETNMTALTSVLPNFNPPQNFYKLGNLSFVGNFDGYLSDFVAYGDLKTALGDANMDMNLSTGSGAEKAKYSGVITLSNFDLGSWTGNNDFGLVSFDAKIRDGNGLTLNSARADLEATLENFSFKNYNYQNILINGQLDKSNFIGKISSSDPNINLDFNGNILINKDDIVYDFASDIKRLDLTALNLSKEKLVFEGDLDFNGSGKNINDLIGMIKARNLVILKGDSTIVFDSINILAHHLDNGRKAIKGNIGSNLINFEGNYNWNTIVKDVKDIVKLNFPYHTRAWKYIPSEPTSDQNVKFDINLGDSQNLFKLLDIKGVVLDDFKVKGTLNSGQKELNVVASIPNLTLNDNVFYGAQFLLNNKSKDGDLHIHLDSFAMGKRKFHEITVSNVMKGDEVSFVINADNLVDSIQQFQIEGSVTPHPKGYSIKVGNNNIKLFGQRWKINNDGIISLGTKFIDIENMSITDGLRTLEIDDINNQGVALYSNRFDLKALNPIINYDKMIFSGEANSSIKINNIFIESPDISGSVLIPSFTINDELYGDLVIDVSKPEGRPLDALLTLENSESGTSLKIKANYEMENKFLNAYIKGRKVPIKFLEYILKDGISEVKGYVDLDANALGTLSDLTIDGLGTLHEGRIKVNYLGEMYFFDKQKISITHDRIDLTGDVMTDSQGNIGYVTGGLNHKLFKDFSLDANISGENVIAINTTKFDNPVYYGIGKGRVSVDFSGSVHAPLIEITAITGPGTKLNIPIKESTVSKDKSFIKFIDKETYFIDTTATKKTTAKVEGVSVVMNLTVTESANINLIFNESTGDIITGSGNGDLKINLTNKGEFEMFGEYTIETGEYLFTALNVINKPFVVRRGGTIRWTGDPINASLDLVADYSVRTSTRTFLQEYLTPELQSAASNATRVNLKLILGNTLFNPSVKFNLEFPELIGVLKNYADSKLRTISTNEVDLNSQVFGLLIFNSFLPSSTIGTVLANANYLQDAGINTITEFLSSQFSLFITSYLNDALEENGLISGVDFEFDVRNNTSLLGAAATPSSALFSEIEVNLKNRFRFLDERLTLNLGGNYVRESFTGTQDYIIPEFFIEYALTKDRKVNLKLYAKYADIDEVNLLNRRNKFGIGIRYRTEFGPMLETSSDLKKFLKEAVKKN